MDLIGGLVITTSAFMVSAAIVSWRLIGSHTARGASDDVSPEHATTRLARIVIVPLLVGFFIGVADVFVTAQLPAVAFVNLLVGISTIAILYGGTSRFTSRQEEPD
jgi:hypothetical protein